MVAGGELWMYYRSCGLYDGLEREMEGPRDIYPYRSSRWNNQKTPAHRQFEIHTAHGAAESQYEVFSVLERSRSLLYSNLTSWTPRVLVVDELVAVLIL